MEMGPPELRGPARIDPADRAQLAESPVGWDRVVRLFRPHLGSLTIVILTVVAASLVGLAQPFLLRAIIDDALPHGDTTLLAWTVLGMIGVAVAPPSSASCRPGWPPPWAKRS